MIQIMIPNNFVNGAVELINMSGNGEARLNFGTRTRKAEIDDFFNNYDPSNTYTFEYQNLREYLFSVKIEYTYQVFQQYNGVSRDLWSQKLEELNGFPDLSVTLLNHRIDANNKYYFKFGGDILLRYIRTTALPRITDLKIEKDGHQFTFRLYLKDDVRLEGVNTDFNSFSLPDEVVAQQSNYFVHETGEIYETGESFTVETEGQVNVHDVFWLYDNYQQVYGIGEIESVSGNEITVSVIKNLDIKLPITELRTFTARHDEEE